MLLTVLNYLMMLSALFEVQISDVRKLILDEFVWRKSILSIFKKSKYSSMFLLCRNISAGSGTLGTLLDLFLRNFMPTCRSGLAGTYMWSALIEYSGFSGQLRIIPSCK